VGGKVGEGHARHLPTEFGLLGEHDIGAKVCPFVGGNSVLPTDADLILSPAVVIRME